MVPGNIIVRFVSQGPWLLEENDMAVPVRLITGIEDAPAEPCAVHGETEVILVEDLSIDGMCGVY
jgi:mycofactocin precursor